VGLDGGGLLRRDEGELHSLSLAKKAVVFFEPATPPLGLIA
jgi:hypothetical protein